MSLSNWNVSQSQYKHYQISQVSFFGAKKDRNALLENKEELQVKLVRKLV